MWPLPGLRGIPASLYSHPTGVQCQKLADPWPFLQPQGPRSLLNIDSTTTAPIVTSNLRPSPSLGIPSSPGTSDVCRMQRDRLHPKWTSQLTGKWLSLSWGSARPLAATSPSATVPPLARVPWVFPVHSALHTWNMKVAPNRPWAASGNSTRVQEACSPGFPCPATHHGALSQTSCPQQMLTRVLGRHRGQLPSGTFWMITSRGRATTSGSPSRCAKLSWVP